DLNAIAGYREKFAAAFPDGGPITRRKIELAIATYERTVVSGPAPFDRWIEGQENAVGEAECAACHSGWNFTDNGFHDIGASGDDVPGRGKFFPNSPSLQHAFKTPTLRDAAHRAPYM